MDATSTTTTTNNTLTTKLSHRGRRLVLFPLPFQGHINPMLQLANILHSKGFSITILHTLFNSPNSSNYPHFTFLPIPGVAGENLSMFSVEDVVKLVLYMNENRMEPIKECLSRLMSEDESVLCLITDAQWFATQKVADELKLPRIVLRTSSVASFHSFVAFPRLHDMGYYRRFTDEETKSGALVPGLEPLKVKDLTKFYPVNLNLEDSSKLLERLVQGVRLARAIIWNTFQELEEQQLETLSHDFPNPHFLIGPFHKYFLASSSSLLVQDQTSISWLDKHPSNSVLYVSFGSLVGVAESEFLEIAWGLANSKQPFLWVVRPGSIKVSKGLELLPDGFLEKIVDGRGYIVKWAPQQEVLAHPATCVFWTHNGWNSTLESICEGVPMICSPSFGDQTTNARYVSDVWKIGVVLENGFERGEIECAIRRVVLEKEGLEMRNRAMNLKDKVNFCLKKGGSSDSSLEDLISVQQLSDIRQLSSEVGDIDFGKDKVQV